MRLGCALACLAIMFFWSTGAIAQSGELPSVDAINGLTTASIIQLFGVITVLSVAPGLLIVATSFTRFIIVFSILRAGLGLQTTPANLIVISLALFMTFYVMSPVFDQAWQRGLQPLIDNQIEEQVALDEIVTPFRQFMLDNTREKDLDLFADLARERGQQVVVDGEVDLRVLVPAFLISEIRRGFEIGFLVIIPFLVIDLIVATIIMAMGMMMLPPSVISLPFKILFFVMIDGWNILVGNMVRSFV